LKRQQAMTAAKEWNWSRRREGCAARYGGRCEARAISEQVCAVTEYYCSSALVMKGYRSQRSKSCGEEAGAAEIIARVAPMLLAQEASANTWSCAAAWDPYGFCHAQ